MPLIDLQRRKDTTDQLSLLGRDQTPHDSTTGPSSQPEDDTSEKVIHESSSTSDSERTKSETEPFCAAPKGTQGQAGSDPEKAHEALAGPDPEPMPRQTRLDPNSKNYMCHSCCTKPEHMEDEFLAIATQGSIKPEAHNNERVIEDNPESHSVLWSP
ncbi:hypothetical protein Tco_1391668 [Tanacetum coccineum]